MRNKIVFDFSSSPWGGSFRRIQAYADYFSQSDLKVLFLISSQLKQTEYVTSRVQTKIISKSNVEKILVNPDYISNIGLQSEWLFSYGIPLRRRLAENQWLHISNVLPFCWSKSTLSLSLIHI